RDRKKDESQNDAAIQGAQLTSVQSLITTISDGKLPPASAKVLIAAALPSLTETQITNLLKPIEEMLEDAAKVAAANESNTDENNLDEVDDPDPDEIEEDADEETLSMTLTNKLAEVASWP